MKTVQVRAERRLSSNRPLSRRRQPPRRIILWLSRIPAEFFKRSSQPNIFRRKFGANIQRSLNETDYIKSSHFSFYGILTNVQNVRVLI